MENIVQGQWFRGPSADLGDTIDQSLRFVNANDTDFDFTQAAGNRQQSTFSAWVKRGLLGSYFVIFSAGTQSQPFVLRFENDDLLYYEYSSSYETYLVTNDKFRDPSAWYHIIFVYDTPNATSADRIRIYINGRRLTSFSTATYPSQNRNGFINYNNSQFHLGNYPDDLTQHWDGYMAEVNFLDGYVVSETNGVPDEFGRYNQDGVWVPKSVSDLTAANYGVNGFRLQFNDSSNLGDDSAPTGTGHASANDLTSNNFETTAISSTNEDNDIDYNDTPTNNYATFTPLFPGSSGITFEHANLRGQYGSTGRKDALAAFGMSSGKYYWEITPKENLEGAIGIVSEDFPFTTSYPTDFGQSAFGWRWELGGGTGSRKNNNTAVTNSHGSVVVGDTVGVLLDTTAGTCTIEINGVAQTSGNGAEFTNIPTDKTIFPYFEIGGAGGDVNFDVNFGQMPFIHEPTGYQHVATNSLPEPTIKNGSDHFRALTGTGANILAIAQGTNTNGTNWNDDVNTGFTNGLWWIKDRANSNQHQLVDSVRGSNSALNCPNLTVATYSAPSGNSVAWCWNVGGAAAENTDGTLTAQVAANTDAGFSIISWTGTGAAGTVGHDLTEAPEFVINKNSVNATSGAFYAWHTGISATQYLALGSAAAAATSSAVWNNTAPTNSVISLGTAGNGSDGPGRIMYAWHSVPGYSAFGSYEGNGPGNQNDFDGAFIFCGFKPSWVMIKSATTAQNWLIYDTTRDVFNVSSQYLMADSTNGELHNDLDIDILSNGFKCRDGSIHLNQSGTTYVYAAFAESPFGGENAPPATAR